VPYSAVYQIVSGAVERRVGPVETGVGSGRPVRGTAAGSRQRVVHFVTLFTGGSKVST
jgi:hypothetical protein